MHFDAVKKKVLLRGNPMVDHSIYPDAFDPMVLFSGIFLLLLLLSPMFLGPLYWLSMVLIHGFSKSLPI